MGPAAPGYGHQRSGRLRGGLRMEFLIITGLSGAGKSRAADVLEDLDYYCVDNMPVA